MNLKVGKTGRQREHKETHLRTEVAKEGFFMLPVRTERKSA